MKILTASKAKRVLHEFSKEVDLECYYLVEDEKRYFVVSKDIGLIDLSQYVVRRIGLPL